MSEPPGGERQLYRDRKYRGGFPGLLGGAGNDWEWAQVVFWGEGNVLKLDWGYGYSSVNLLKITELCT